MMKKQTLNALLVLLIASPLAACGASAQDGDDANNNTSIEDNSTTRNKSPGDGNSTENSDPAPDDNSTSANNTDQGNNQATSNSAPDPNSDPEPGDNAAPGDNQSPGNNSSTPENSDPGANNDLPGNNDNPGPGGEGCGEGGAACADGEFCKYAVGGCGETADLGVCTPLPAVECQIADEEAQVCGCDGETYDNECLADAAGVSIAAEGPCASGPDPNQMACGGQLGMNCGPGSYCGFLPETGCGAAGIGLCLEAPEPASCPTDMIPVCGCDGETYHNECEASSAGVSVSSYGECGPPVDGQECGGFFGAPCGPGQYCKHMPGDMCGAADQSGICVVIPTEECDTTSAPVCGCDGRTYQNDCIAESMQVSVFATGPCAN